MRQQRTPWEQDPSSNRGDGYNNRDMMAGRMPDFARPNMLSPFELKKASSYFAAMAAAIQLQQNQNQGQGQNAPPYNPNYRRNPQADAYHNQYTPNNRRQHPQNHTSEYRNDNYNLPYNSDMNHSHNPDHINGASASTLRSPILEDFRTNKNRKFEVRVLGQMLEYSGHIADFEIGHCWYYRGVCG